MTTCNLRSNVLALLVVLSAGCATGPSAPKHAGPFPRKVALLPFNNGSLNMDAPGVMRNLIDSDLAATTIETLPVNVIDAHLKDIGITDGGQLRAVIPAKLGTLLEADGLLYGEIEDFKAVNVGVYINRVVDVRLKLVDAQTGTVLWEGSRRKAKSEMRLNAEAVKSGALSDLASSPFKEQASEVALLLVRDLGKARKNW